MKRDNHKWGEPKRPDNHNTIRTCRKCEIIKLGRHEGGQHWTEYWRGDRLISVDERPACKGAPPR